MNLMLYYVSKLAFFLNDNAHMHSRCASCVGCFRMFATEDPRNPVTFLSRVYVVSNKFTEPSSRASRKQIQHMS